MILIRKFKFDAAHNLVKYHGKCERLHGHTYKLVVKLEGEPGEEDLIMDFSELKNIVESRVLQQLDHSYINDFIKQPSAENIARWIWDKLYDALNTENCRLYEVEVWETENCGISYRGE
jgi:6-pyruvoyltetrahydropterin/6-carboxytetrahydropterin synthase